MKTKDGKVKKKTPSTKTRVVRFLQDFGPKDVNDKMKLENALIQYGELLNLSKVIRNMIYSNNAITFTKWTRMEEEYKRYYNMQLEHLAHEKGISIYCCKKQWAASLIMAQTMKNKADADKKRMEGQTEEDEVYIYIY